MKRRLTNSRLKRMILQEMKGLGMVGLDHLGAGMPQMQDEDILRPHHDDVGVSGQRGMDMSMMIDDHDDEEGMLDSESCCLAVKALAMACSCPKTRSKIMAVCDSLMSGHSRMM